MSTGGVRRISGQAAGELAAGFAELELDGLPLSEPDEDEDEDESLDDEDESLDDEPELDSLGLLADSFEPLLPARLSLR